MPGLIAPLLAPLLELERDQNAGENAESLEREE